MDELKFAAGIVGLLLFVAVSIATIALVAERVEVCHERITDQGRCSHRQHRMTLEQGVYVCRCEGVAR